MSLSISQGIDKVGITVETDPLAAKKANNLNDLQSIPSARTNLGLGTAAVLNSTDVAQVSNNLSEFTATASTARTNLGLGTMATATATNYLDKAGNLTGLGNVSTARSNLGLGTMAVATATDYLDKAGNLSGLGSASTARSNLGLGGAAVANFASELQSVSATSSATVVSPVSFKTNSLSTNIWIPGTQNLASLTSGAGASVGSNSLVLSAQLTAPNASTAGYVSRGFSIHYQSNSVNLGYNYGLPSGHSVRIYSISGLGTAIGGVKIRGVFGRFGSVLPTPSTLSTIGYGWEWDWATRTMYIIAHNGTTLTTTPITGTFNPLGARNYEITCISDGAGNISLYADGVLIGTSTGGPTSLLATGQPIYWQIEVENQATASVQTTLNICNPKVFTTNG